MLTGVFLRHFKNFKGIRFIPFSSENFNLFIGENGAGKSSILQSIDSFFNNGNFILNSDSKRKEAFLGPVLLFSEEEIKTFSKDSKQIIITVSDFIAKENKSNDSNYSTIENFFHHRDSLKGKLDKNYYILLLGQYEVDKDISFLTFNKKIRSKLISNFFGTPKKDNAPDTDRKENELNKKLQKLKDEILNYISFIYIPVETSIEEFLRIEKKGMQELMSEDIKATISNILEKKKLQDPDSEKETNILDALNSNLEKFISEVEETIQLIYDGYDFQRGYKKKQKISSKHLTDEIINVFFSKRKLRKDKKSITDLSAGERKKALIDVVYSFLKQNKGKKKNKIILGVDEPESSLHISMCYDQFMRLNEISKSFNYQVLVTTHWYGIIPILESGTFFHLDPKNERGPEITSFSFREYFSERGVYPDDIYLKSFFDLTSSIISSMRNHNTNWLIVEGIEDKNYIESHLPTEGKMSDNLKILPVGGCEVVKLLYEYLYLPISQSSDSKAIKGNVFCLIDTDEDFKNFDLSNDVKEKLKIRRLLKKGEEIMLVRLDSKHGVTKTEIEDSMDPLVFYNALMGCAEKYGETAVKESCKKFEVRSEVKNHSKIEGDDSILRYKGPGDYKTDKDLIKGFIETHKIEISNLYYQLNKNGKPSWINEIEGFFKS